MSRTIALTRRSSPHPRDGSGRWAPIVVAVALASSIASAAETGDFNGDGRVSFADYLWLDDGGETAPGSFDLFEEHWCDEPRRAWSEDTSIPSFRRYVTIIEAFRRAVDDPMPHFYDIWPDDARNAPFPHSESATLTIHDATAEGGENDRVRIRATLTLFEPTRGFAVYLESGQGVLRVPLWKKEFEGVPQDDPNERRTFDDGSWWDGAVWWARVRLGEYKHPFGDLPVSVTHPGYLATRGRIVITYGMRNVNGRTVYRHVDLAPGEYSIEIEARIARGTPAGDYTLRLLEGSEVAFLDGRVETPTVRSDATLRVESDVTGGWDGSIPPLDLDVENRRVIGSTAMRLVGPDGLVQDEGDPIASGEPGDELRFVVQFRTDVPLNRIHARLEWPAAALECVDGERQKIYVDPESGELYEDGPAGCSDNPGLGFPGRSSTRFLLAGHMDHPRHGIYEWRPLEYFRPLGEWRDLLEITLRIPLDAQAGDEIPLRFKRQPGGHGYPHYVPAYHPYGHDLRCDPDRGGEFGRNWHYDAVEYTDGVVRVLPGGDPPPPPIDAGIEISLSDATGEPGELVEVPVFASARRLPFSTLRFVLAIDPNVARVERYIANVAGPLTDAFEASTVPGQSNGIDDPECLELEPGDPRRETCARNPPVPFWIEYHDSGPEIIFVDVVVPGLTETPTEIGRFELRIRENATAARTFMEPTTFVFSPQGDPKLATVVETSGELIKEDRDRVWSPVSAFRPGSVSIRSTPFRRGDANGDNRFDISDPIAALEFLFLGRAGLECADGADANDSGALDVTDAIFALGVLFRGDGPVPPPQGQCAEDPTDDGLSCSYDCSDEAE